MSGSSISMAYVAVMLYYEDSLKSWHVALWAWLIDVLFCSMSMAYVIIM